MWSSALFVLALPVLLVCGVVLLILWPIFYPWHEGMIDVAVMVANYLTPKT